MTIYLLFNPRHRLLWFLILATAIGLELAALFFQYGMHLDPCVLCVYERLAVAGIALSGLLGLLGAQLRAVRLLAMMLWATAASWGLVLALEHTGIQLGRADLNCEFFANFPEWFKLDVWIPAVFNPTGYCSDIQWQFIGLSMPQWMIVVYAGYLVLLLFALLGELRQPKVG